MEPIVHPNKNLIQISTLPVGSPRPASAASTGVGLKSTWVPVGQHPPKKFDYEEPEYEWSSVRDALFTRGIEAEKQDPHSMDVKLN